VIPELIVVGIANTDRERDLTFEKSAPGAHMPTAGGAANFLRMIREEIFPLIESRFRTASFRILHGHSLGGYVASRTFLNDPRAFNAYIAVSSSLQMESFHWLEGVEKKLRDSDNARTFFQLTLGNEGYRTDAAFEAAWTKFTAALGAEKKPHYAWAARRHLDDNHGSIPIISTYEGLRAIFTDYSFENAHEWDFEKYSLGRIQEHYRRLSEKYGYPMAMPLPTVLRIGQQALKQGPIEEAAAFIEEHLKLRPGAPMLYLLKAGLFQARKDMAQAMALIKKAREMATSDERVSIDSIVRYALTPKK
jgi:pimeloyl-ACP methyl ester carboxylesterase